MRLEDFRCQLVETQDSRRIVEQRRLDAENAKRVVDDKRKVKVISRRKKQGFSFDQGRVVDFSIWRPDPCFLCVACALDLGPETSLLVATPPQIRLRGERGR